MRGLKGSDGPCVAAHSRSTTRQLGRGGLPPSLAPLVRNPFTPPRHYHPFILCIVGRGLDPSATFRPTPANGSPVGEGFIPPVHLRAAAHLPGGLGSGRPTCPFRGSFCREKSCPFAGRRGRRPPTAATRRFSRHRQRSPAAWGQAALHPTLPHSVGAGHARPAASPLPPLYLLPRREGS